MAETEIRPTGTLRIAGWLLVVAGLLRAFVGALDYRRMGWLVRTTGELPAWLAVVAVAAGVVLIVMASRRAAANREAAQRAALARI